jgi:hypothetical protein
MLALDKQGLRLGMDRARLMERLALAERHVREGACHVARQREIVAQLKGHSHDAASARDLLTQFEALQALHVSDRDRLRAELAALPIQ